MWLLRLNYVRMLCPSGEQCVCVCARVCVWLFLGCQHVVPPSLPLGLHPPLHLLLHALHFSVAKVLVRLPCLVG